MTIYRRAELLAKSEGIPLREAYRRLGQRGAAAKAARKRKAALQASVRLPYKD